MTQKIEKKYYRLHELWHYLGLNRSQWYRSPLRHILQPVYLAGPRTPLFDITQVKKVIIEMQDKGSVAKNETEQQELA